MSAVVHVNSRYRSGGSFAHFQLPLSRLGQRYNKVAVSDVCIPNSMYTFDEKNNVIIFSEGGGDLSAVITPGEWALSDLLVELKTQLEVAGAFVYTVTESQGRITIAATGAFRLKFSRSNSPAYRLGFASVDTGLAVSHTASFHYNLAPENNLYLWIEGLPNVLTSDLQPVRASFIIGMLGNSYTILSSGSGATMTLNDAWCPGQLNVELRAEDGSLSGIQTDWSFNLLLSECDCGKH